VANVFFHCSTKALDPSYLTDLLSLMRLGEAVGAIRIGTTQPVDIEEEGRSPTVDSHWLDGNDLNEMNKHQSNTIISLSGWYCHFGLDYLLDYGTHFCKTKSNL